MMMLIAVAAAAAQPSLQAESPLRSSVTVPYADLELRTIAGQRELDMRLNRAALRICTPDVPGEDLVFYDIDTCVAKVLADAASDRRRVILAAKGEIRTAAIN